jgi:hypothetical protein
LRTFFFLWHVLLYLLFYELIATRPNPVGITKLKQINHKSKKCFFKTRVIQFVCTHSCSYEATSFKNWQVIAYICSLYDIGYCLYIHVCSLCDIGYCCSWHSIFFSGSFIFSQFFWLSNFFGPSTTEET